MRKLVISLLVAVLVGIWLLILFDSLKDQTTIGNITPAPPPIFIKTSHTEPTEPEEEDLYEPESSPSPAPSYSDFTLQTKEEIIHTLKQQLRKNQLKDDFSVLEVVSHRQSIGKLASSFPAATWISAGGDEKNLDPNRYAVGALTPKNIARLHASPQLFEYLVVVDWYGEVSSWDEETQGKLLSLAKQTFISLPEDWQQQLESDLLKVAKPVGTTVQVEQLGRSSHLVSAVVQRTQRDVQHHYGDGRPAGEGGTCSKYRLFHDASNAETPSWLCELEKLKGDKCPSKAPACSARKIPLSHSSWVNVRGLAGLGLLPKSRAKVLDSYLRLPRFGDCPPWNACAMGNGVVWCDSDAVGLKESTTMDSFTSTGCARMDFGMKYTANVGCCLDLLLTALDGCGYGEKDVDRMSIGFNVDFDKALQCRSTYLTGGKKGKGKGMVVEKFEKSYASSAAVDYVYGSGPQPARMNKDRILEELKALGVPPPLDRDKRIESKNVLVATLEKARLELKGMSDAEVKEELRRLRADASGSASDRRERLKALRFQNQEALKQRLDSGVAKNREVASDDSKRMTKSELAAELSGTWGVKTDLSKLSKEALLKKLQDTRAAQGYKGTGKTAREVFHE